jgi:hypothetical protein
MGNRARMGDPRGNLRPNRINGKMGLRDLRWVYGPVFHGPTSPVQINQCSGLNFRLLRALKLQSCLDTELSGDSRPGKSSKYWKVRCMVK